MLGRSVYVDGLEPLATDPPSKMNVFGHYGHTLRMDGTQIGVLKETHKVCFCCLLQSKHRMALETQISLHKHNRMTKES